MSEIYNEEYYHNGCGPIPYEEPEHWVQFFGMIADRIVADLNPKTVLDAGCAMGYLVAALRDRGVEAYGVDISDYAISMVREDIKPYCKVGSLTEKLPEELPQHFDLVVTIEVLEHLYAEDGKKMIANLCSLADTVLFSSTPDDFEERTHVNVQQREYWARLFFEQGFIDDLNYRPRYLTYYASLFRRSNNILRMVEDYERNIRITDKEITKITHALEETQRVMNQTGEQLGEARKKLEESQNILNQTGIQLDEARQELTRKNAFIDELNVQIESVDEQRRNAEFKTNNLSAQLIEIQQLLNEKEQLLLDIQDSISWRITRPLYKAKIMLSGWMEKWKGTRKIKKAISILRHRGIRALCVEWKNYRLKIKELKLYGQPVNDKSNNKDGYSAYDAEYQKDMDFSGCETDVKVLAFYLPQFHTFKENDEWWGKGFTEWDNVKKGAPRFEGHYQPRIPHDDWGYYYLNDISVLEKQAMLAKQHGIYGFCFYYYWFSGKRLMEKPVDMLLAHPEVDLPFCLCWANENWTRAWDGQNRNILIAQEYSEEDDEKFIIDLKKYLEDSRYIKIQNKPVILVYNPGQMPSPGKSFDRWRKVAKDIGIGEILIWTCQTANHTASLLKIEKYIDAEVEFPPHNLWVDALAVKDIDVGGKSAFIYNYQRLVDFVVDRMSKKMSDKVPVHRSFMLAWDNAARRKDGWFTFYSFSLQSLYKWVRAIINRTRQDFVLDERFAFVNAWNEWGEGTYLEPDARFGYANINTVSKALFAFPFDNNTKIIGDASPECCNLLNAKTNMKPHIAVQIHMFYLDVLDEIAENLNKIPFEYDCYISTDTQEKKMEISKKMQNVCNAARVIVDVFENRGRDVAPFIEQMRDHIDDYEYVCHVHSKKTVTGDYGNEWRKYNFRHLFGSSQYMKRMFSFMENNDEIGIIFPEIYPVLKFQAIWGGNKEGVAKLLKRVGIDTDLPETPVFPVGNMFWAKTKAIKPIFKSDIMIKDFPEELGQVNATLAHQIERAWVYVAKSEGFEYCKVFNSLSSHTELNPKVRLGIYVHYDSQNVIAESDLKTIQIFGDFLTDLVVVTNSELSDEELNKIPASVKSTFIRKNKGYDFAAWRDVLHKIGKEELIKYDELILFNNSFFNPVFDIRDMFQEMENRRLDFWGVSIFPYSTDGSYIGADCIPEHIQSYFMVFNNNVIVNTAFWEFWDNVQDYESLREVIANCETRLTEILAKQGFVYEPYIRETYYLSKYLNNYALPYEMPSALLLLHNPFVKKKCYQHMNDEEKVKLEWFIRNIRNSANPNEGGA